MKINTRWIIITTFSFFPVIYFISRVSDISFRDNLMGNWFATMIGAIVGILTAIEINSMIEKTENAKKELEEKQRKKKILGLIKEELEFNLDKIKSRRLNLEKTGKRSVSIPSMKDELWNAFSDGGEIEWINDPQLLDTITRAYYYIRSVIYLEDKYFDVTHFPGPTITMTNTPESRILNYLNATDKNVIKNIDSAIEQIGDALN